MEARKPIAKPKAALGIGNSGSILRHDHVKTQRQVSARLLKKRDRLINQYQEFVEIHSTCQLPRRLPKKVKSE